MKLSIWIAILFSLVLAFLVSCGSSTTSGGSGDDTEYASAEEEAVETELGDDDWRLMSSSQEVFAGIKFNSPTGTLTIINSSDSTIGSPSLKTYDLDTGETTDISVTGAAAIASGETFSGAIEYPGGSEPDDDALITLDLDGVDVGVFMTALTYASLPPIWGMPSVIPNPGIWSFEMDLDTAYLEGTECPTEAYSTTSSGEFTMTVANSGLSAMWDIDGSYVNFNRGSLNGNFDSPLYSFPVETDDGPSMGYNDWEFAATSTTEISGQLSWDNNQGCTATYPITLEFVSLENPSIIPLCEGTWSIEWGGFSCGGYPVTFPLPASGTVDVHYIESDPFQLTLDTSSGMIALPNNGGTNVYGTGSPPSMVLGSSTMAIPYPPYTAQATIAGGFILNAVSQTQMMGVVSLVGYGAVPCNGAATVTLEALSTPGCP